MILCGHFNIYVTEYEIGNAIPIFFQDFKNGSNMSIGVSCFFILSGATNYLAVQKEKYYYRRFRAIYPQFWIAWLIVFFYTFYVTSGTIFKGIQKWKLIYTFLGLDGWLSEYLGDNWYLVGEWFLGVIIVLYLFSPILNKLLQKNLYVFCMVITFITVISILLCKRTGINYYTLPTVRLFEYSFGMLFEYCRSKDLINKRKSVLVLICALGVIFTQLSISLNNVHTYILFSTMGIAVFIILYFCGLCIKRQILIRFFEKSTELNFSMYLVHHHVCAIIAGHFFIQLSIEEACISCLCVYFSLCI